MRPFQLARSSISLDGAEEDSIVDLIADWSFWNVEHAFVDTPPRPNGGGGGGGAVAAARGRPLPGMAQLWSEVSSLTDEAVRAAHEQAVARAGKLEAQLEALQLRFDEGDTQR